jgi:competence protein ComEA
MAPIERLSDTASEVRPGSIGSRTSSAAPSPLRAWTQGPWAKVIAKAAGVGLLMLGLGGIGALAMAQGLTTHSTPLGESSARRAPSKAGWASHASLASGISLSAPPSPAPTSAASDAPGATPPAASGLTADGRVILNLASEDELRKLPGVGQKRALAILALRQKLGRFKRPADLLRIRGIGPKRLQQMLPKLVLDPPKDAAAPAPSVSGAPGANAAPVPSAASPN